MEDLLKITYKERSYSLKELMEDDNQFSKSLLIPEDLNVHISKFQWSFTQDYGYMIAADKFGQLYHLLATAKFALTQAYQKIHKSPILWSSGYPGQLWLRSQYLKNAFLWYNSTDDYLLQIIWFAFDFFKQQDMTDPAQYKKELKACRWDKLFKALKLREAEPAIVTLIAHIEKMQKDPVVAEIREIANSLKHHANLEIKNLQATESIHITSYLGFDSKAVENTQLDIDDACDLLKKGHQIITEFSEFLLGFIDFEAAFPPEEDGKIHMDKLKPKATYKKFFINPRDEQRLTS
jgi:hypothetical protein